LLETVTADNDAEACNTIYGAVRLEFASAGFGRFFPCEGPPRFCLLEGHRECKAAVNFSASSGTSS
jgi:hypothetical protein